jgi:hypothetical protein
VSIGDVSSHRLDTLYPAPKIYRVPALCLSVILCGSHPFFHSCTPIMFNLIRRADFSFSSPVWDHISDDAKVSK